jgi:hypothetical protein
MGEEEKLAERRKKASGPPREVPVPVRFRDVDVSRLQSEDGMLIRQLIEEMERDGAETGPAVDRH